MATLKSSCFLLVPLLISYIVLTSTAEARLISSSSIQSRQSKDSVLVISSAPSESNTNTRMDTDTDTDAKEGYSKFLGTLGMVCKCCDGAGEKCKTKWLEPCPNLKCHPWKQLRS